MICPSIPIHQFPFALDSRYSTLIVRLIRPFEPADIAGELFLLVENVDFNFESLVKFGFFTICIYSNSLHTIYAIHIDVSAMHSYSDFHSFITFFYMVIHLIFIVGFNPCFAVADFILPHTDQMEIIQQLMKENKMPQQSIFSPFKS